MKQAIGLWIILISANLAAQTVTGKKHSQTAVNCKTCHACEYPTAKDPCLADCPRGDMITIRHKAEEGPEKVILSELSDRYVPVMFSHKRHAEMSEMSGGCQSCHHYNTTGPILPCKDCHEQEKTELNTPGLKGAYHRQCMDCHRAWSHQTECNSCHALKSENKKTVQKADLSKSAVHPKLDKPSKLVYETSYEGGKLVTFYHSDHADVFQLACTTCHQNQTCVDCHDVDKQKAGKVSSVASPARANKTKEQKHQACFGCHSDNEKNCTECHNNKVLKPFNHLDRAGWALNRFHARVACIQCHVGGKNQHKELQTECISCHRKWNAKTFDHKITGLILSENHITLECDDCHTNKKFSQTANCSNCHDDKTYPKDKPGKLSFPIK
jgi:hypothetical protein